MSEYKLVPVVPTAEMLDRVCPVAYSLETRGPQQDAEKVKIAQDYHAPQREAMRSIYKAMLAAAPAVQGEPVAEEVPLLECASCNHLYQGQVTRCDCMPGEQKFNRWLARPQPAEQQPAPDVSGLVEALTMARETIASALRANAPDYFTTDADIARHVVIQLIDAALRGEQS